MRFEWDPEKAARNERVHGVRFEEAQEVFRAGVESLELHDSVHSIDEDRFVTIGPIEKGVVLVVWTEREEDIVRIISARWATRRERELYRSHVGDSHDQE